MADTQNLPKNARATQPIRHKYASYSAAGTLLCVICRLELKSDSLWDYHLKSAGHILRLQDPQLQVNKRDGERDQEQPEQPKSGLGNGNESRKRKASGSAEDSFRKRNRPPSELPSNISDLETVPPPEPRITRPMNEIQIPSRPATPLKPSPRAKQDAIDEDEWAAFEADVAAEAAIAPADTVISAPALSEAELAARLKEQSSQQRKAREEAEVEGDKEDAERKLEEEFDRMESLESKVRRLKEKRETLRKYEIIAERTTTQTELPNSNGERNDDDDDDHSDDDSYDDDEWDGFRMKG